MVALMDLKDESYHRVLAYQGVTESIPVLL